MMCNTCKMKSHKQSPYEWFTSIRPRCNICHSTELDESGHCPNEQLEREWSQRHWYELTDGSETPSSPVCSPMLLTWYYPGSTTGAGIRQPLMVRDADWPPLCMGCGNAKHALRPCLYCEKPWACEPLAALALPDFLSSLQWACIDCYAQMSDDHMCINEDYDNARILQCTECEVWSHGVAIYDHDPKFLPTKIMAESFGIRVEPWRCTQSGCRQWVYDELPSKECGFCQYSVCSRCTAMVACSSLQCAPSRPRSQTDCMADTAVTTTHFKRRSACIESAQECWIPAAGISVSSSEMEHLLRRAAGRREAQERDREVNKWKYR